MHTLEWLVPDAAGSQVLVRTGLIALATLVTCVLGGLTASAATPPRGAPSPVPPPPSADAFLAAAKTVADRTPPAGYTGQYVKLYYPASPTRANSGLP
jgi:hypothetical protein